MGIKALIPWLRKKAPSVFYETDLELFRGQRVAIDSSIYLHRFVSKENKFEGPWLHHFAELAVWLRSKGIRPVYVFDGKRPEMKLDTNAAREAGRIETTNGILASKKLLDEIDLAIQRGEGSRALSESIVKDLETIGFSGVTLDSTFLPVASKRTPSNQPHTDYKRLVPSLFDTEAEPYDDNEDSTPKVPTLDTQPLTVQSQSQPLTIDRIRAAVFDRYRTLNSRCNHITREHVSKAKQLLTAMGLPWVQAPGEAEKHCSWLANNGYVSAVATTDSDVHAYGTKVVLKDIHAQYSSVTVVLHESILEALGFTHDVFVDFCIACGTDYNQNMPGYGPDKIYQLMTCTGEGGGSDTDIVNLDNIKGFDGEPLDTSILKHREVRKLFSFDGVYDETSKVSMATTSLNLRPCNTQALDAILGSIQETDSTSSRMVWSGGNNSSPKVTTSSPRVMTTPESILSRGVYRSVFEVF